MGSRVIKLQICDRCAKESKAPAVGSNPPGWGKLVQPGFMTYDLCSDCVEEIVTELKR